MGVPGREMEESHFVNFAPQKPKIWRICERAGHARLRVNIGVEMRRRKSHARDEPFVEYCAAFGRRIGMCG